MIGWAIIFAFLTLSVSVAVFVAPFTITEAWSWRDSATAGRLGRDVDRR
jgi:hypothetical protein